jgi:hypothetical protein
MGFDGAIVVIFSNGRQALLLLKWQDLHTLCAMLTSPDIHTHTYTSHIFSHKTTSSKPRPPLPPRSTRHPTLTRPIHSTPNSLYRHTPLLQRASQLLNHRFPRLCRTRAIPAQLLAGLILVQHDGFVVLVRAIQAQTTPGAGVACRADGASGCCAAELAAATPFFVGLVLGSGEGFAVVAQFGEEVGVVFLFLGDLDWDLLLLRWPRFCNYRFKCRDYGVG